MDIVSPTITNLIIFVLAIYVGYHVVWTVTKMRVGCMKARWRGDFRICS